MQLTDSIVNIHTNDPLTVRDTNPEKAFEHLSKWVTVIPVVDIENKLIGISRLKEGVQKNIRQRSIAILGLGYVGLTWP